MNTTRIAACALALIAAIGFAACDKDNVGPTWDTTMDTLTDTVADTGTDVPVDTAPDTTPDTLVDTTPDITTDDAGGTCDHNGFTAAGHYATRYPAGSGNALVYNGLTGTTPPVDVIAVELYYDFGGSTTPGTFALAGTTEEANYATCGTCVLVRSGCDASGACTKYFFQTGGTLTTTAHGEVGGQFTGTMTGVTLEEVTINSSTFESTPVPGGEGWCISTYSFDAAVAAPG